jgi:hypothetical protein
MIHRMFPPITETFPMKLRRRFLSFLVATLASGMCDAVAAVAPAQEKPGVAQLAFLAGTWRGPSSSGTSAEELISTPEGGVIVAAGREFRGGKCVFYDLVVITARAGVVSLIPHPYGKPSPRTFPLVTFEAAANRATFENQEHDFPKVFVYELVAPDHLRITLTGEKKGQAAKEVFDLRRAR